MREVRMYQIYEILCLSIQSKQIHYISKQYWNWQQLIQMQNYNNGCYLVSKTIGVFIHLRQKVMLKLITNLDIFKIKFLFYPPFWIHIKISYCFPIILSIFSQVHLLLIILTFFTFQLQYFKLLIFKTMQTRIIYGKRKHSEISVKDLQSPLYKKTLNQPVKISSIHHFKANTKIGQELCGKSNNSMNLFDSGKLESFDKLYEFDDICYNKYQLSDFKNLQEINLYELPTDYHL